MPIDAILSARMSFLPFVAESADTQAESEADIKRLFGLRVEISLG